MLMYTSVLVFYILLLASFSSCGTRNSSLDWWQTEVIYQIYPRSFMDSNADGIGDLKGVYKKLPYIKRLGVGAIWFSPIFTSPMVDFGYDISNYRDIDPTFGNMRHFELVLRRAHKLGLKVLLDLVPNHTSDKHEWFQKSIKRIAPFTDYYIWKEPKYVHGKREPPNNWISEFGKSAWEWNEERNQYYLHQFAIQQPDLNYRNPVVYEEMKNILIYWLDKGVDGFRVDAVNFLYENVSYPDEPRSYEPFVNPDEPDYLHHIYSRNQPETFELVKDWRKILDKYSQKGSTRFMMIEAYADLNTTMKFYGTSDRPGSHFPFNFLMIKNITSESNAILVSDMIRKWYAYMPDGAWANWVMGNHDNSRPASRFGRNLIDGLHMFQLLLPGTPIVYNGDELGMEDTFIRWDQSVDPPALNAGPLRYKFFTRDPERTPFQWNDSENAGFTTNLQTWLPVNPGYWKVNVITESVNTTHKTHLQIFKHLVALRRNIVFQKGDLHLYVLSDWVLAMVRAFVDHTTYVVVMNLGSEITISNLQSHRPSLPNQLEVVVASVNSRVFPGDLIPSTAIKLRPKASVVLATTEEEGDKLKQAADARVVLKHEAFLHSYE